MAKHTHQLWSIISRCSKQVHYYDYWDNNVCTENPTEPSFGIRNLAKDSGDFWIEFELIIETCVTINPKQTHRWKIQKHV